jgi:hypothetical protein
MIIARMFAPLIILALMSELAYAQTLARSKTTDVYNKSKQQIVAGYIEWAHLLDIKTAIPAKLDTGAKSSSLNAVDIIRFMRSGEQWVRFSVNRITIERPIVRIARIRRAGAAVSKRPVIRLSICVSGITRKTDVTLANRKGMNYALLIGRSFLRSEILVDSGTIYLGTAACQ